jgi:hypothetical protein
MVGLWSSIIVQENNYNTKMKDIDAIVQDMTNKYDKLIVKMKNLEDRVSKMESEKNINKIKLAEDVEELEELEEIKELEEIILEVNNSFFYKETDIIQEEKELIQMMNEDIKIITDEIIENEIVDEIIENETSLVSKSLDDEIVDLSEHIYPVSNQNNKKGWIKTLLFM